jgi:uncharacterized MAPEG superfamily protein
MTTEVALLVWSVALCFGQMLVAVLGSTMQVGLPALAGNRDDLPPPSAGWVARAHRAHRNMLENLLLFAALVLAVVALNGSNATTVLGAQLFFWGRLAYAAIYLAGIPWLRTGAWAVSVVGLVLIFLQVV